VTRPGRALAWHVAVVPSVIHACGTLHAEVSIRTTPVEQKTTAGWTVDLRELWQHLHATTSQYFRDSIRAWPSGKAVDFGFAGATNLGIKHPHDL
jgi:hypothetical protein